MKTSSFIVHCVYFSHDHCVNRDKKKEDDVLNMNTLTHAHAPSCSNHEYNRKQFNRNEFYQHG